MDKVKLPALTSGSRWWHGGSSSHAGGITDGSRLRSGHGSTTRAALHVVDMTVGRSHVDSQGDQQKGQEKESRALYQCLDRNIEGHRYFLSVYLRTRCKKH